MCLYSKLVRNPKYISNKKNGGVVPAINDIRVKAIPIKCGSCMECMRAKAREWKIRLSEEIKDNPQNGIMVTLTFSNESYAKLAQRVPNKKGYELDNTIATKAVRLFTERWRKKYKKAIRHWLVTELGHTGTEHIHLHGIIWTNVKNAREEINKYWQYGWIYTNNEKKGYITNKTINYYVKYIHKQDLDHLNYIPIILTSKGIGKGYISKGRHIGNVFRGENTQDYYRDERGYKLPLPIYYRNNIYTEEQRELLWIYKLNEEKRYILGQEIDMSNGIEKFYQILKEARKKSKRLGYPTTIEKASTQAEEEARRIMLQQKKIEDGEYKIKRKK